MFRLTSVAAGIFLAGVAAFPAAAAQTVVVGNIKYTCPNSCVVTQGQNGPAVRDSGGAQISLEFLTSTDPDRDP